MLRFLFILSRCCVVFRGGTLLEMLSLFYDIAQKLGQNSSPITVSQCDATQHWPSLWRKQYKNRQWQELQYPTVAPRVRQTFNLFSDLTSSWYQSLISLRSIQWESTPYQAIWLEHDLILSLLWWSIFSVIYWHESKAIKGTEKILPDYIMKEKGGGGNKQLTSTVFDDFPPYSVTRQHFKVANNEQMPGKKQKPAYEQYLWFKYNKKHRNFVEKYDLSLKENKTKTNAKDRQQRQV